MALTKPDNSVMQQINSGNFREPRTNIVWFDATPLPCRSIEA